MKREPIGADFWVNGKMLLWRGGPVCDRDATLNKTVEDRAACGLCVPHNPQAAR